VHERGFRIDKDYQDRWCFKRPDGIAVPHCGYHCDDMIDQDIHEISKSLKHPSADVLLTRPEKLRINRMRLPSNGRFAREQLPRSIRPRADTSRNQLG
jgi:hypothetical protein